MKFEQYSIRNKDKVETSNPFDFKQVLHKSNTIRVES